MSFRPAGNIFRSHHALDTICWRCSRQLKPSSSATSIVPPLSISKLSSRSFSRAAPASQALRATPTRLKAGYFISNDLSIRTPGGDVKSADPDHIPPHRRRQQLKKQQQKDVASSSSQIGGAGGATATEDILPDNASSILTTQSTKQTSFRRQLSLYLSLSKPRLTVLIVLTAMAPYALYPVPDFISPSLGLDTPSLSPLTLTFLTAGTALCSASANALNMLYELSWDAMMSRTRNRPLVRGLLSQRKALAFAVLAALAGVSSLYFGVNPTVAFLGAANIALYAGVYTPLKRVSSLNTWAGAVVGGIPPLMGWAAAAGEYATGEGTFQELLLTPQAVGGWLFAALLFAWQFPHFMALSWSIRDEYRAAGHQMLCWINPARNGRVALRYSIAFFPICLALCAAGVTEWSFAATSLPVNLWLVREAVRFHRHEGFKGSARGLFWASVWHLPAIMVLALVQKKDMWSRVWRSVVGDPAWDEDEEFDDDDE
ncbi:UbiA prenyltransferase family-domain-containing protein [Xylaria bambusicola]|uniref:UbiA prenyltransferase family-domain-containing protein n=1 Tax=Xylaria bambusicola TaxID=326684 RepID=UPI002007A8CD|nr:UbiA prenyltransferase family-domain-containing protein [Xylaria bambusicola]KAI0506666.1 UbiA prenyltransferase family-domain-containing protein [Xylaria bambusicola]